MANWTILKTAIADVVRANGNQEITGPLLQSVLNSIVNAVGEHATFVGVATPSTNPGVPDGPVFYLASKEGIYPNFGLTINFGESAVFKWQEDSWVKLTTGFATTALVDKHLPNSDLMSLADTRENTLISSNGALSGTTQDAKVLVIDVSDYWTKEVYISTTKTTGTSLFYAFYNSVDLSSSSYMPEGVALAGNSFSNVVPIPPGAVKLAVANIDNTFVDFKVVLLGVGGAPYDKINQNLSELGSEVYAFNDLYTKEQLLEHSSLRLLAYSIKKLSIYYKNGYNGTDNWTINASGISNSNELVVSLYNINTRNTYRLTSQLQQVENEIVTLVRDEPLYSLYVEINPYKYLKTAVEAGGFNSEGWQRIFTEKKDVYSA